MKLRGFTIAELASTFIIIGVLAILFWQLVFLNYTKRAASSKIRKFHSLMKQVQIKAQTDESDWLDYYFDPNSISSGDVFLEKYILPYVTYLKKTVDEDGNVKVFLADTSSLSVKKEDCMTFAFDINQNKPPNEDGKDIFYFVYCPKTNTSFFKQGDFVPYLQTDIDGRAAAKIKCKDEPKTCSGFISFDDFNIGDDYPFKIPG